MHSQTFNEEWYKYEGIKPIHSYVHFAARRFKWSIPEIRDTYDDDFFPVIRLEEEALEVERKAHNKGSKKGSDGHTGGVSSDGVNTVEHIPDPEYEDSPEMENLYNNLMEAEVEV